MLHKNIKKLYFSKFFHNLIFAYVIERLFWQSRGMTAMMVVYTEIVYAIVITILEIPTGVLADKFSKKKILVIADILSVFELIILVYAHSFQSFAAAVAVAGVSTSLRSGTERALLYESLKIEGNQSLFEKCLGRLNVFDFSAACIAALIGSFIANNLDLEVNYYLSTVSLIIALIITATLKDIDCKNAHDREKGVISKAINTLKFKPILWIAIASFCVLGSAVVYVDEFWQLYLVDLSIPVMCFGVYSIVASLFRMPGGLLVHRFLRHAKHLRIILWLLVLMMVFLALSFIFSGYAGIISLLFVFILDGLVEPIVAGFIHHRIQSDVRATMDSFLSFAMRIVIIPIGLGFGYLATAKSVRVGFGYLAIVLFVYSLVYLVMYVQNTKQKFS